MSFEKIYGHPNKNLIIKLLRKGNGVRAVEKTLKEMHPDDKKLHLSAPTLQKFRKEKLNIEGRVLETIKSSASESKERKQDRILSRVPSFRQATEEAVQIHIDIRKELQELLATVKLRVEDLFDKASEGKLSVNEEANLHKYFASWTTTIQQWAKYIDKIADRTVETNVNITIIEDQMVAIRNAVREVIEEEMDQETAMRFMYKLSQKISELTYRQSNSGSSSIKDLYDGTRMLSEGMPSNGDDVSS